MKNISSLILLFGVLLSLFACLKENNGASTTSKILFLDTRYGVRNILDTKCASCHALGKKADDEWLYDANDYERSIKAHIEDIYESVQTIHSKMAKPSYGNLTQTEVDSINHWYTNGYPTQISTADKIPLTHPEIKALFDAKCASCHQSGASSASSWLYDATDYSFSILSYKTILQKVTLITKTMPPTPLTTDELNLLTAWFQSGTPAS